MQHYNMQHAAHNAHYTRNRPTHPMHGWVDWMHPPNIRLPALHIARFGFPLLDSFAAVFRRMGRMLHVVCRLLSVACGLLSVACGLLHVVCAMSPVACCVLPAACCNSRCNSIRSFVQPERLTGENAYACAACTAKRDELLASAEVEGATDAPEKESAAAARKTDEEERQIAEVRLTGLG